MRRFVTALVTQGLDPAEIAEILRADHRLGAIAAMREAHRWSQKQVADEWNRLFPEDLKTYKNISYWENWRNGGSGGRMPDLLVLEKLARVYRCRVSDLVRDCGDYRANRQEPSVTEPNFLDRHLVAHAFARAEELEREALIRWPHVWTELDRVRAEPLGAWPLWCLLPSAATAMVIGGTTSDRPAPVGAVAALYAWRYARSVYVFEPSLAERLVGRGVDELGGVKAFSVLPEWCVYIASDRPDRPQAGLWAYLDYHAEAGRPELRLVLDLAAGGLDSLLCVPVYLDRPTLTEALGDWRTTALTRSTDVRGGHLDKTIATMADAIERLLGLLSHLAGNRAHIHPTDGSAARPHRAAKVARRQTVWLVTEAAQPSR